MLIFECTFSLANVVHLVRLEYLKLAFDVCEALRTCSFARSTMAGPAASGTIPARSLDPLQASRRRDR